MVGMLFSTALATLAALAAPVQGETTYTTFKLRVQTVDQSSTSGYNNTYVAPGSRPDNVAELYATKPNGDWGQYNNSAMQWLDSSPHYSVDLVMSDYEANKTALEWPMIVLTFGGPPPEPPHPAYRSTEMTFNEAGVLSIGSSYHLVACNDSADVCSYYGGCVGHLSYTGTSDSPPNFDDHSNKCEPINIVREVTSSQNY